MSKSIRVLYDTKILFKLKGKINRTTVNLTILYETKGWTIKNKQKKISIVEMKKLHLMCGKTRLKIIILWKEIEYYGSIYSGLHK